METYYKKLLSNLIIFLGGNIGSKLLTFLLVPFYTSILTTQQYGEIDVMITSISLLVPVATMGLIDAIFRYSMTKEYSNNAVLSVGFLLSLSMYVILFIVLEIINSFIKWEFMFDMSIMLLLDIIYEILLNYLKAIERSKLFVMSGFLQTSIALGLNVLFLAVCKLGIRGWFLAYCNSYFFTALFIVCKIKVYEKIRIKNFNKELAKQMLAYGIPLIFSSLSWWVITSSDRYMIRYYQGSSAVGIYSIAAKIPTILQTMVTLFMSVWQISVNDIYENNFTYLKTYIKNSFILFGGCGYVAGSLMLFLCQSIMKLIARNEFYNGWIYAPFLILSVIISIVPAIIASLYGAYKNNRGACVSTVLGAVINVMLNMLLIPLIGIMGAVISTVISRQFIGIYRLIDTKKLLAFKRQYMFYLLNNGILLLQAVFLLKIEKSRYISQIIFLILVTIFNKKSVWNLLKFVNKKERIS